MSPLTLRDRRPGIEAALTVLPYAAVFVGLYGLRSAWGSMLAYHLGALLLLSRSADWSALARGWRTRVGLPLAALCALVGPTLYFGLPLVLPETDLSAELARVGIVGAGLLPFAIYYCLVNPWLEEVVWRGRAVSSQTLPSARDLAFAGYHFFVLLKFVSPLWALLSVVVLAVIAGTWRRAAANTGGLAVPAAAHAVANVSLMWATYLLAN